MSRERAQTAPASLARMWGIGFAAAALALCRPAGARAEQMLRPRWEVGAGVAALTMPAYRGSGQQRAYMLPVPYVVYRGEVLKVDREKVAGMLFSSERVTLDVSFSGSAPAPSDGLEAREGLPDLAPTFEAGPQLEVLLSEGEWHRLALNVPARRVVAVEGLTTLRGIGWVTNPSLNLEVGSADPGKGWEFGVSGGPLWADVGLHDYYYGVPDALGTPGRPAYRARGGYSGAVLTLSATRRYPRVWVGMFLRANLLHGAVFEESPLVEERTGWLAGLAVSWVPFQSRDLVLSDD